MGVKMPFKNSNKDMNKFLFEFSNLCGQLLIDEHIALENPRIKNNN